MVSYREKNGGNKTKTVYNPKGKMAINSIPSIIPTNNFNMPLGPLLTESERATILAHDEHGMPFNEIGRRIGRHPTTVARYLRNPNPRGMKKRHCPNKKLSERDVRHIIQLAVRTKKSAREILNHLNLTVTTRRIQQVLSSTAYLRYAKLRTAPYLQARHKVERLNWSRRFLQWNAIDWKSVIFTDEKKFNLDGPDGLACYWHDLRKEPERFSSRQQGGRSVMVWGAISYKGTIGLNGIEGTMDSKYYCNVLEEGLLPAANEAFGDVWTLMHDGASVHRSKHTQDWLDSNDIHVLDWPAKSPDLNLIENCWGQLARSVYKDGRQFEDVDDLGDAVQQAWLNIDVQYIKKLYKSLPNRLISVVDKKGGHTDY